MKEYLKSILVDIMLVSWLYVTFYGLVALGHDVSLAIIVCLTMALNIQVNHPSRS